MPTRPSDSQGADVGGVRIRPRSVIIRSAHFDRAITSDRPASERSDIKFNFGASRLAEHSIGAELTVASGQEENPYFTVTARVVIDIEPVTDVHDLTQKLAGIASRLGPVILFPYIRELIADLSRRSGMRPLTLPVLNVGTMFTIEPEELEWVPPAEADTTKPAKRQRRSPKAKASKKVAE